MNISGQEEVRRIGRFLSAGFVNTIITVAIYQLVVTSASPTIAYAVAWFFGVCIVMILYPTKVFSARVSIKRRAVFGLGYISLLFLGLALTAIMEQIGLYPRVTVFLVIAVTSSLSYIIGRFLFVP